jgi:hypothetical protein
MGFVEVRFRWGVCWGKSISVFVCMKTYHLCFLVSLLIMW